MKIDTKDKAGWGDEELVMISMIEHYSYCPRQCALIHLEDTFDENIYTIRGHLVHERVDEPDSEIIDGVRIERALPIWSEMLGLTGRADVVEFHANSPYPVEYKSGYRKERIHEELQLCGQIFCIEEMFDCEIEKGAIFYHASKKRREIVITNNHREKAVRMITEIRKMLVSGKIPPAQYDQRCKNCSLVDSCLPKVIAPSQKTELRKEFDSLFNPKGGDTL